MLSMITIAAEGAQTFAEATVPADWYSPIVTFISNNSGTIITGFAAILAISAGIGWFMKTARKATR